MITHQNTVIFAWLNDEASVWPHKSLVLILACKILPTSHILPQSRPLWLLCCCRHHTTTKPPTHSYLNIHYTHIHAHTHALVCEFVSWKFCALTKMSTWVSWEFCSRPWLIRSNSTMTFLLTFQVYMNSSIVYILYIIMCTMSVVNTHQNKMIIEVMNWFDGSNLYCILYCLHSYWTIHCHFSTATSLHNKVIYVLVLN